MRVDLVVVGRNDGVVARIGDPGSDRGITG